MQKSTKISCLLALVFFIFIDQLSKYIIRTSGGFYICNPNLAFGIRMPIIAYWFFIIILSLSVIFLILNYKFKILNEIKIPKLKKLKLKIENFEQKYFLPSNFSLILILSGAISNAIDRLYFGCVIDFIDLKIWPVFNLADSFIVIGVIIILIRTTDYRMNTRDFT